MFHIVCSHSYVSHHKVDLAMRPGAIPKAGSASTDWSDILGMWTSIVCFLHCLLTPILLSFSAVAAHVLPGEERTHRTLAILVALFGAASLLFGFRKHRRTRVLLLMTLGLGLICLSAWFGDRLPSHAMEVAVTFAGSLCMIRAHRLNHTFCRSCACAATSPAAH